jgi:predicted phosphoadenosine phosphosulfate sulfurtransferase
MGKQKSYIEQDVYTEALNRIRNLYDTFDKVVVSFSGGKDSTALLNICIEVAREKNKLPVEAVFFDEEAIHPTTIEYVERVANNPEINLKWYCLEVKHRNACSNEEPFWYTWDIDKKDLWVRNMPKNAITSHKNFKKGMSFQEFSPFIYDRSEGKIAMLTGIRTEESLRRYRVIAQKNNDFYINAKVEPGSNQCRAFPIYDWSSEDVWLAVHKYNWDYNRTYDLFNKTKLFNKFLTQRVCPPYGEEPLRGLWVYAECFPELWHKMLYRVKGVATAWRYANTELYGMPKDKPLGLTWKEYMHIIIDSYEHDSKNLVKKTINRYIRYHNTSTKQSIPEEEPHPLSGICYKLLCNIAIKGDMKERQRSKIQANQLKMKNKLGLSQEELERIYG